MKKNQINQMLRTEELFLFIGSLFLFNELNCSWWVLIIFFLFPDISMLGYYINNKFGALIYNIVHFRAISIMLFLIGIYFSNEILKLIAIILFSHSTLDRVFGYGLKLKSFKETHLGKIK